MNVLEKARARREQHKVNQAGRTKQYKFKEGKTAISLLPLHADIEKPTEQQDYVREYGMHYIKDAKGKMITSVGDRSLTYGETCVVREGLVDLQHYAKDIGDDDLAKQAKDSLAKKSNLIGVYVHKSTEGKEEGPQIISVSDSFLDQMNSVIEEYAADELDVVTRWDNRLVFVVDRVGTTATDTRYTIGAAKNRATVPAATMSKSINLEEYVKAQFDDSIQKALNYIATATGKSVEGSAAAAALTGGAGAATKAIAAPKADADDGFDFDVAPSKKDAPTALDKAKVEDAEFEAVTETAPWDEGVGGDDEEDLLAQIDALAA